MPTKYRYFQSIKKEHFSSFEKVCLEVDTEMSNSKATVDSDNREIWKWGGWENAVLSRHCVSWVFVLTTVLQCLAAPRNVITAGKIFFFLSLGTGITHCSFSNTSESGLRGEKSLLRYYLRNGDPPRTLVQLM